MRFFISICISVFLVSSLVAQSKVRSRSNYKVSPRKKALIKKENIDIEQLITKAEQLAKKSPDKAIELLEEALIGSIKQKDRLKEGKCYVALAKINADRAQWSTAIQYYQTAKSIYQSEGALKEEKNITFQLGKSLESAKQYYSAIEEYKAYLTKANTNLEKASANLSIANSYYNTGLYKQALTYYEKTLTIETLINNSTRIARANADLAKVKAALNEITEADSLLRKSKEINLEQITINEKVKDISRGDYQNYYESLNEAQDAILDNIAEDAETKIIDSNYRSSFRNIDEFNTYLNDSSLQGFNNNLATTDINESIAEIAVTENRKVGEQLLEQNKVDEAITYFNNGVAAAESVTFNTQIREEKALSHKSLSNAYAQKGEYDKALEQFNLYTAEKDSILSFKEFQLNETAKLLEKQKDISLLERDIALFQKETEVLEEQISNQETTTNALIIILTIIIVALFFIYKNSRSRKKANQFLALKSLRSQMNPHFIFNALNSVNSFIAKSDERSANRFLTDFSKLMRMVLENSKEELVTLTNELSVIELYLKLEHYRFRDKFEYTYSVDESIHTDTISIPPMLIQPFIENAVWHGLRYKKTIGQLDVSLKKNETNIQVIVADNGIGRKKSKELKTTNQKHNSTGLKNSIERLQIINQVYLTKYNLTMEDLDSTKEETGTVVTLTIPC